MYALAVIILITAQTGAVRYSAKYSAATEPPPPNYTLDEVVDNLVTRSLRKLDDREGPVIWPQLVVRCARELGISRCMKAFALCRAQRAATATAQGGGLQFDLEVELERQFPWESYSNASEEQLDSWLLDRAAEVFHQKAVTLTYPGIVLDVDTQRNGSLRIDLKKDAANEVSTARRRISWYRRFYRMAPLLILSQMIYTNLMPILFPILKFKAVVVLIANLMALGLSIFNLFRFDDETYEQKVVYVKEPFRTEDKYPPFPEGTFPGVSVHGFPGASFSGETFFPSDLQLKKPRKNNNKKNNFNNKPSELVEADSGWSAGLGYPQEGLSAGRFITTPFGFQAAGSAVETRTSSLRTHIKK